MSRLLCCLRASADMGAALSHPGEVCDARLHPPADPPTMADVIRERKKKAGGAALGTLRRRLAAAARRGRDARPGGCEHARFIRGVVGAWRLGDVFALCEQLEGGAALRDLATQAELAREPAAALRQDLAAALRERRRCDVELVGAGWALAAHRALLAARSSYFRELLARHAGARVPLEGAAAALSREEVEAVVGALYGGAPPPAPGTLPRRSVCAACSVSEWERGGGSESEGGSGCACGRRVAAARLRRLGELLGFAPDALARDLRRALDAGAGADTRLRWAGAGADCGFVRALELPCHRVVLAARSRFFRGVLARARPHVCLDDRVLPRRFARALLHAAYTDQVDLTLVGRSSSPTAAGAPAQPARAAARSSTVAMLDDAFQLYEIARFLEMPIVVQGCEDAIVRALSADTLPHVLRWAGGAHASAWVQRQAARYLRDEFVAVMAGPASARLPRAALADALASPFLQASEPQALRALLRWAERAAAAAAAAEPNVVWHTRGRGRRAARPPDGGVRAALAGLAPLVRTEHIPPDCDALAAAARRGLLAPAPAAAPRSPDAWLGRGAYRPPRCFLPYLDELKALLADQAPPPEGAARRARYLQRIPDTLYMVAAARERGGGAGGGAPDAVRGGGAGGGAPDAVRACVPAAVRQALRARARELRGSSTAARALALHAPDTSPVLRQIALRAVREMSLPDECADLLLAEPDPADERESSSEWGGGSEWGGASEWGGGSSEWGGAEGGAGAECCRAGSLRCASAASVRSLPRARPRPRLSAAVPDVAMAPNANTHLLSTREQMYAGPPRPAPARAPPADPAPPLEPGGLQLDLGDGATHTPRPGSRAQRAARRELPAAREAVRRVERGGERGGEWGGEREDDELRAAYELSARVYGGGSVRRLPRPADLLPDEYGVRSRASPSPSALSVAGSSSLSLGGGSMALGGGALSLSGGELRLSGGELRLGGAELRLGGAALTLGGARRVDRHTPPPRHPHEYARGGGVGGAGGGVGGAGGGVGRSPSPRRSPRALSALYSPHHSRGHSPNYA